MTAARSTLVIAALLAGTAGCLDSTFRPQTAWEARLLPVGTTDGPGATLAAVTRGSNTIQAGITFQGAPATTYGWEIARGTCSAPGPRIGALGSYPNLVTDAEGEAEILQTFITGTLEPGGDYYAAIVNPQNRTTILSCGRLEEFESE